MSLRRGRKPRKESGWFRPGTFKYNTRRAKLQDSQFLNDLISSAIDGPQKGKKPVRDVLYINTQERPRVSSAPVTRSQKSSKPAKKTKKKTTAAPKPQARAYFGHAVSSVKDMHFCERSHKFDAPLPGRREAPYRSDALAPTITAALDHFTRDATARRQKSKGRKGNDRPGKAHTKQHSKPKSDRKKRKKKKSKTKLTGKSSVVKAKSSVRRSDSAPDITDVERLERSRNLEPLPSVPEEPDQSQPLPEQVPDQEFLIKGQSIGLDDPRLKDPPEAKEAIANEVKFERAVERAAQAPDARPPQQQRPKSASLPAPRQSSVDDLGATELLEEQDPRAGLWSTDQRHNYQWPPDEFYPESHTPRDDLVVRGQPLLPEKGKSGPQTTYASKHVQWPPQRSKQAEHMELPEVEPVGNNPKGTDLLRPHQSTGDWHGAGAVDYVPVMARKPPHVAWPPQSETHSAYQRYTDEQIGAYQMLLRDLEAKAAAEAEAAERDRVDPITGQKVSDLRKQPSSIESESHAAYQQYTAEQLEEYRRRVEAAAADRQAATQGQGDNILPVRKEAWAPTSVYDDDFRGISGDELLALKRKTASLRLKSAAARASTTGVAASLGTGSAEWTTAYRSSTQAHSQAAKAKCIVPRRRSYDITAPPPDAKAVSAQDEPTSVYKTDFVAPPPLTAEQAEQKRKALEKANMQQDHWASLFPVDEDAKWPPQSEYDTEFIDFPDDKVRAVIRPRRRDWDITAPGKPINQGDVVVEDLPQSEYDTHFIDFPDRKVVKPLHPKPREWDIIAPSKRTAVAAAAAVPDASAQSSTAAVQKSSPPVVTEDAGDADAFPQSEYDREFIDFPNDKVRKSIYPVRRAWNITAPGASKEAQLPKSTYDTDFIDFPNDRVRQMVPPRRRDWNITAPGQAREPQLPAGVTIHRPEPVPAVAPQDDRTDAKGQAQNASQQWQSTYDATHKGFRVKEPVPRAEWTVPASLAAPRKTIPQAQPQAGQVSEHKSTGTTTGVAARSTQTRTEAPPAAPAPAPATASVATTTEQKDASTQHGTTAKATSKPKSSERKVRETKQQEKAAPKSKSSAPKKAKATEPDLWRTEHTKLYKSGQWAQRKGRPVDHDRYITTYQAQFLSRDRPKATPARKRDPWPRGSMAKAGTWQPKSEYDSEYLWPSDLVKRDAVYHAAGITR